jgi:PWWP domain
MTKKVGKIFNSGDLVFAKVRGYPPWPARVTVPADKNSSKFHVFFYGTYETAVCKKEELWHYDDSTKAKFGKNKSKMFPQAMDEMVNRPEIALAPAGNYLTVKTSLRITALTTIIPVNRQFLKGN